MFRIRWATGAFAFLCAVLCVSSSPIQAQTGDTNSKPVSDIPPERLAAVPGLQESTSSIMRRQALAPPATGIRPEHELAYPDRSHLPQDPDAPAIAQTPSPAMRTQLATPDRNIHTTASSFDGATLTDTNAFPPDSMGTVGPTQFVVFVNGRIRSFTKAGTADGVINADPDVFFSSVMTPVGGSVVLNFTSDPQVRYDRFSARWYLTIIDVPCTAADCSTTAANRVLLAVSDAASAGTISASTVWTFFQFQADPGTNFCDYPSLGIDVNALYVGCNMFNSGGTFVGTNGYVIRKTSVLGAGPIAVTRFANMATSTGAGPESPRGVDNFDANATEGYFVGPDNASFSRITFRRISNPGSATPTISANIPVTVATTTINNTYVGVDHLGNTGGANGRLDALDDRFFQAMIRNGHLWAAHNFTVSGGGVASTNGNSRYAARWYEFTNLTTAPTVLQFGTVYDSAGNRSQAAQYWIPSIVVNGQDHAVMGFTQAGVPFGATPAYTGRLATDTLGTMSGVPGTGVVHFGTAANSYNPPKDDGSRNGARRWGDYSFTVVDPIDDMSIWTIQEYNQATDSYAVRVAHLQAPPPATPTCSTTPINFATGTGNVTINAASTAGSGFYDPGANLSAPALPFSHLSATVSGGTTVNSTTYNSPTQVTLNITTTAAGLKDVTITNPDGQSVTATNCIDVIGPPTKLKFTTQPANGTAGQTLAAVAVSVEDAAGNVMTSDNTTQVTLSLSSNTVNGTLTRTAVNGVATFADLSIDAAATGYSLSASSNPALTPDTSSAFDISPAAAAQLAFAQQPSDSGAGATIAPAVTVRVLDPFGNLVNSDTSAVSIAIANNPGSATLSGTSTRNAVAGVATFTDLSLDKTGTGYTLSASDGALTGTTSDAFAITPAAAASLAFGVQPSDTTAGVAITPAVTVRLFDAFGNLASNDNTSTVSLGVSSGPGTVSGGGAVTISGGVATFANLVLTSAGTYTLAASSGVLPSAASTSFVVAPATGNQLVFVQQPSDAVAGSAIAPAVQVQLQDQFGNALNDSGVSITLTANGPGSIVAGDTTSTISGIATFGGVVIQTAGSYSLTANSIGYTPANSDPFAITPAAASQLVFGQQPGNAIAGQSIAPAIALRIEDGFGNIVTSSNAPVALALNANPGSATLSGGGAVAAVNGVATFANVALDKAASGYTLDASSVGLTPATSNAFDIAPGTAAKLAYTTQPASNADIIAGTGFDLVVQVQDASGNLVASDTSTVTIAIGNNAGGATLAGTSSANASGGVATFTGLSLNKAGSGYTLIASDANAAVAAATSNAFNIGPAALDHLAFVTQPPASVGAGTAFGVSVQLQDAFGNVLAADSGTTVNLVLGANPGGDGYAGASTTDSAGAAGFAGVSLSKAAGGYTLVASANGKSGTSSAFDVTPAVLDHLSVTQQPPATALAGNSFNVSVELRDVFENVLSGDNTSPVGIALDANPGNDAYAGGSTVATAGAATFSVALSKPASGYRLALTSGTASVQTSMFAVVPNSGILLAFVQQPANVLQGSPLGSISVEERDGFGNRVIADSSTVVTLGMTVCGNPVTLGTASLANGLATFDAPASAFRFYTLASGLQLQASGGTLSSATSQTFNVAANSDIAFTDGFEVCRP